MDIHLDLLDSELCNTSSSMSLGILFVHCMILQE